MKSALVAQIWAQSSKTRWWSCEACSPPMPRQWIAVSRQITWHSLQFEMHSRISVLICSVIRRVLSDSDVVPEDDNRWAPLRRGRPACRERPIVGKTFAIARRPSGQRLTCRFLSARSEIPSRWAVLRLPQRREEPGAPISGIPAKVLAAFRRATRVPPWRRTLRHGVPPAAHHA